MGGTPVFRPSFSAATTSNEGLRRRLGVLPALAAVLVIAMVVAVSDLGACADAAPTPTFTTSAAACARVDPGTYVGACITLPDGGQTWLGSYKDQIDGRVFVCIDYLYSSELAGYSVGTTNGLVNRFGTKVPDASVRALSYADSKYAPTGSSGDPLTDAAIAYLARVVMGDGYVSTTPLSVTASLPDTSWGLPPAIYTRAQQLWDETRTHLGPYTLALSGLPKTGVAGKTYTATATVTSSAQADGGAHPLPGVTIKAATVGQLRVITGDGALASSAGQVKITVRATAKGSGTLTATAGNLPGVFADLEIPTGWTTDAPDDTVGQRGLIATSASASAAATETIARIKPASNDHKRPKPRRPVHRRGPTWRRTHDSHSARPSASRGSAFAGSAPTRSRDVVRSRYVRVPIARTVKKKTYTWVPIVHAHTTWTYVSHVRKVVTTKTVRTRTVLQHVVSVVHTGVKWVSHLVWGLVSWVAHKVEEVVHWVTHEVVRTVRWVVRQVKQVVSVVKGWFVPHTSTYTTYRRVPHYTTHHRRVWVLKRVKVRKTSCSALCRATQRTGQAASKAAHSIGSAVSHAASADARSLSNAADYLRENGVQVTEIAGGLVITGIGALGCAADGLVTGATGGAAAAVGVTEAAGYACVAVAGGGIALMESGAHGLHSPEGHPGSSTSEPMLGEGGTKVTSRTLDETPKYHIDVENPDPGGRPGQLHIQDYEGGKWLYNFTTNKFTDLPRPLEKLLAKDPKWSTALAKAKNYLNVR